MLKPRKVITIDGLAASGKSTLAHGISQKIGYAFLSSGLFYRLAGYLAVNKKADLDNQSAIADLIGKYQFDVIVDKDGFNRALLEGADVTSELQSPEVSQATSIASAHASVRELLLNKQRMAFAGRNLVAEGRDMGTVVFPNAELKFYISVDPQTRIERRLKQYVESGSYSENELKALKDKMEIEILERDKRDSERELSPTKPAADAIIINNSGQTLTEVVESMYDFVAKRDLL